MKTYEVMQYLADTGRNLLVAAGLIDGLTLNQDELKNEAQPIFWFINTNSKIASEKETYITYSISGAPPLSYGDGEVMTRQGILIVEIFTRKRSIDDLIKNLNDTFLENSWAFELGNWNYDSSLQMYYYQFECQVKVISDE